MSHLTAEQKLARGRVYSARYREKYRQQLIERGRIYYAKNKERERAKNRVRAAKQKALIQIELAGRPKPSHCECCGDPVKLVFDHCHTSGEFRGWICAPCNQALGNVKDDPVRLAKLIEYLARFRA